MRREVVYRGMDAGSRVTDALERAVTRLERKVSRLDHESAFLRVVMESHPTRPRSACSAHLALRGTILHAREERPDPVAAIKAACDDLRGQIERHGSHTRKEHLRERFERPAQVLAEQLAQQAGRDVQALKPLNAVRIEQLQRFVRRESFYRRLDGRFPYGMSPDAVVDETVVLALEEADEKPDRLPYEVWLLRLARRALDRSCAKTKAAGNGSQDTHVEWEAHDAGLLPPPTDDDWLTYFQPDEEPSVGDVTPDVSAASPEDLLARRELHGHVHRILGQLPESWRHAFTLCTIEGFDLAAAATSLELTKEDVRQQITLATQFLREKLRETGYHAGS